MNATGFLTLIASLAISSPRPCTPVPICASLFNACDSPFFHAFRAESSSHFRIDDGSQCDDLPFTISLSLSLSLSHTHTHTQKLRNYSYSSPPYTTHFNVERVSYCVNCLLSPQPRSLSVSLCVSEVRRQSARWRNDTLPPRGTGTCETMTLYSVVGEERERECVCVCVF